MWEVFRITGASIKIKGDTLEFQNIDALYFPKICIICGNSTNMKIEKDVIGKYSFHKDKRTDYNVKIPVCKTCTNNMNVNKKNESFKIVIPSIIGLIIGIIFMISTYSFIFGISLIAFTIIIPYFYLTKFNKRINLENYVILKSRSSIENSLEDILQITIQNKSYMEYMIRLNLAENRALKMI